jgi:hypothetical protein
VPILKKAAPKEGVMNEQHPDWDMFFSLADELAGGTTAKTNQEILIGTLAKDSWSISVSQKMISESYTQEGDLVQAKEFETRSHERRKVACELLQALGDVNGHRSK